MAQELALTPLPDDVDMCLAEAEELLFARDRITSALADRVGRVHRAGQAKQHGHASTRCWLRTSGGMTVGGAGRLLTLGAELPRLPVVREKFAAGELAAGVVEAICAAVAGLTDEQVGLAEPILVDLAGKAGAAEVAKAGRHLRAVLDPDGEERDERADYGRRFLRVRPGKGGGVEGEFYLPREAGARLMALLQAYAKLRAQGDDRPLTVRQADALIALLEQKIVTELLVVVSAESLPTDPETTDPTTDPTADPATDDADPDATGSADDLSRADDTVSGALGDPGAADGTDDPDIPEEFNAAHAEAEAGAGAGAGAEAGAGSADDISDSAPHKADDNVSDAMSADDSTEAEAGVGAGSDAAADGATDAGARSAGDACATAVTGIDDVREAEADPATNYATTPATDSATDSAPGSADATAGLRNEEPCGCGAGEREAGARRPGECEPRDTANTASAEGDHTANADSPKGRETISTSSAKRHETAPAKGDRCDRGATQTGAPHAPRHASACPADDGGHSPTAPSDIASSGAAASDAAASGAAASDAQPSQAAPSEAASSEAASSEAASSEAASSEAASSEAAWPDPPPEDASTRHTHAGPRPAGDCRHGQDTPRTSQGASPGTAQGASPGAAPGASAGTMPGAFLGASLGASAGTMPGASLGSALGASASTLLGASLGGALGGPLGMVPPGLLLATGQVLPVSSVHRLARTSTLVRIVMNADGQVLDMGRKVRLATPAQRRAIFARYATCWVDGCPLPATMCQIDHADNWSTGGLTDLKLLGPACQFHNRDRYQHPDRYTRRNVGEDRWAFTYHRLGRARRLRE
ncbi:HNH endonuclease [Microbispora hainanensis]|uniref:HNH endonuclease n=2 Tax=Microbispora hainanensis TaxID=568844 RepID=A0ABZ1T023_9ACTN|nr:DUF222 domain-containing protein [Microbispora hainanensis]